MLATLNMPHNFGTGTQDYEIKSFLGKGGFGNVYEAVEKRTGLIVAIKKLGKCSIHSAI